MYLGCTSQNLYQEDGLDFLSFLELFWISHVIYSGKRYKVMFIPDSLNVHQFSSISGGNKNLLVFIQKASIYFIKDLCLMDILWLPLPWVVCLQVPFIEFHLCQYRWCAMTNNDNCLIRLIQSIQSCCVHDIFCSIFFPAHENNNNCASAANTCSVQIVFRPISVLQSFTTMLQTSPTQMSFSIKCAFV